ncbi:hypothetical protein Clacol_006734 [Clathrus columnatus]|uniref:Uncharacterized protein n=1 Tax=Clathrus columnatus TaxID=1419009 RepID=A0AAV5AFR0_9AGAM|nr:hypothetical protein Clacol_006734 [Clathrus columnatus]
MDEFKEENRRLQAKVYSLSHTNDALQRKLFEYDEMHNRLVTSLGFSNVAEAMNSIIAESQSNLGVTYGGREKIRQLEGALATQLEAVKAAENSIHSIDAELRQTRQELNQAMEDIKRLRHEQDCARKEAEKYATDAQIWRTELETKLPEMQNMLRNIKQDCSEETLDILKNSKAPETTTSDASESIMTMKNQLERLKIQYQALLLSKNRITEKYQEDLVKWRRFKEWTVKGQLTSGGTDRRQKLIIRRKRPDSQTFYDKDVDMHNPFVIHEKIQEGEATAMVLGPVGDNMGESLTQPSEFPSSQTIHGILPSPVSTKKRFIPSSPSFSNNANRIDINPESSTPGPSGRRFIFEKSIKQVTFIPQWRSNSLMKLASPLNQLYRSNPDDPAEKSPRTETPREPLAPKRSFVLEPDASLSKKAPPTRNATLAPEKGKQILVRNSSSEEDSPEIVSRIKSSINTPTDKTVDRVRGKLTEYMQFKGRGRYSNVNE